MKVEAVPLVSGVPAAQWVELSPLGPSDWEVVECNAGWLEQQLLEQVAVG